MCSSALPTKMPMTDMPSAMQKGGQSYSTVHTRLSVCTTLQQQLAGHCNHLQKTLRIHTTNHDVLEAESLAVTAHLGIGLGDWRPARHKHSVRHIDAFATENIYC